MLTRRVLVAAACESRDLSGRPTVLRIVVLPGRIELPVGIADSPRLHIALVELLPLRLVSSGDTRHCSRKSIVAVESEL
jgi:hypothetical protein